jgi:glycosyltransferase involved in cell wall biosynthesis
LAAESGLSAVEADDLLRSERRALAPVRAVVVTSQATARLVHQAYNVPRERISVIEPGTDRVIPVMREPKADVTLLAVGAVVPRKGYDVLVAALALLRQHQWQLTIVGDCTRDSETVASLRSSIDATGLTDRISLAGALSDEELANHYASADLFVLASRFEGYGMAIAEAIAYGLPVVSTRVGAIPETLPAGTGILTQPDDVHALSMALRTMIEQPAERQKRAAAARKAATALPTWSTAATQFADVLQAAA